MAIVNARTSPYYRVTTNRVELNNRRYTVVRSIGNGHVSVFESSTNGGTVCIHCAARRNNTQGGA